MSRYRRKPQMVEAEKWHAGMGIEGEPGDVVVTTPDGERFVCNPDEFAATYEPIREPELMNPC